MTFLERENPPANEDLENFAGIVNEVLQFGFNDGPQVNRRRVKMWVNEALRQIAREVEATEFQETEVLDLVQGQWKYPLPNACLRIQDVFYPENYQRLRPVDLQQFDNFSPRSLEAPPMVYTIYKSELWVFPAAPNSTDTLEIRFVKKPEHLSNDSDVPNLDPDYWHLLVDYAVARAFEAEDDQEAAQAHIGRYKSDLAAYATDVQTQIVDRPRVVDGTWAATGYSSGRMF